MFGVLCVVVLFFFFVVFCDFPVTLYFDFVTGLLLWPCKWLASASGQVGLKSSEKLKF